MQAVMTTYEYKVVPAPRKGVKGKGIKGVDGRFANGLEKVLCEYGADGWEYLRSDTLPSDERSGIATSVTTWRTVLVFRRPAGESSATDFAPRLIEASPETEDTVEHTDTGDIDGEGVAESEVAPETSAPDGDADTSEKPKDA